MPKYTEELTVKKYELDNLIKQNNLPNNFILFGESSFLIEHYTKLLSDMDDANLLTLYHDEYNINTAKSHISQGSLFGGVNLLVIKSEKKIPKKELEQLFELSNKGENRVIFGYFGDDYKTYASGFKNLGVANVRFFHPNQNEAISIVDFESKQRGLNLDRYTINHLLSLQNYNIELSLNELDKLSIYKEKEITTKEIDSLVYGMGEVNINDFLKKLVLKDEFLKDLENLLEHGEDEIRVLNVISSFFNELNMFNIYIRENGNVNAKEILGYNPPRFVVDEKARLSMKIQPKEYLKIFEILVDAELDIKLKKGDKRAVLYSVLFQISKVLKG